MTDQDEDQVGAALDELNGRGLLAFVKEGEVLPKGLSFKRWSSREVTVGGVGFHEFSVAVNLTGDGFRVRMLVRPGQEPQFELLVDWKDDGGYLRPNVWGVIDALKNPHESRRDFLCRMLEDDLANDRARVGQSTDGQRSALLLRDLGDFNRRPKTGDDDGR